MSLHIKTRTRTYISAFRFFPARCSASTVTAAFQMRYNYPQFLWITLWIAKHLEHNFFLQHDARLVLLKISSALSSIRDR